MRPSSSWAAQDATALSGGTDLIGRMKDYVSSPERVVYLKDIKELAGISGDAKLERLDDRRGDPAHRHRRHKAEVREAYPALWQATVEVGSPQIRNMATAGRQPAPAARVAGTSAPATACWACKTARAWSAPATTASTRSS